MNLTALIILFSFWITNADQNTDQRIVIQNHYWAKTGLVDSVYAHRLYASEVRRQLGLKVGRVLLREGGSDDLSDVIWECEYANMAEREEDLRKLQATGEFEPVMEKMGTLIRKFARGEFVIEGGNEGN